MAQHRHEGGGDGGAGGRQGGAGPHLEHRGGDAGEDVADEVGCGLDLRLGGGTGAGGQRRDQQVRGLCTDGGGGGGGKCDGNVERRQALLEIKQELGGQEILCTVPE